MTERPTIVPAEPTPDELAATTERRRREQAEQEAADRRAESDLATRSKATEAAVLARLERLRGVGSEEVAAAEESAWTNLPEHRRKTVYPEDFRKDVDAENLMHLAGFTLDGVQDRLAADLLHGYLESGHRTRRTMIVNGTTGAGKTTAAFLVGRGFLAKGKHVRVVSQRAYLAAMRPNATNRDGIDAERFATRLKRAEVLVLDDLGMDMPINEPVTPFVLAQMTALINERVNAGLITIVTTNLGSDALERMFDSRFVSRLGYEAVVVKMHGTDLRQPATW